MYSLSVEPQSLAASASQGGTSSLPSSGDVVDEDPMLVDEESGVNPRDPHDRSNEHSYDRDVNRMSVESSGNDRERDARRTRDRSGYQQHQENDQMIDFDEFLQRRGEPSRDTTVTRNPELETNYEQLFQPIQENEDFYSTTIFERLHQEHQNQTQWVTTSDTSAHLYPGNQDQRNSEIEQQRTYYNLSWAAQELPTLHGGQPRPTQTSLAPVHYGNSGECSSVVGQFGSLGSSPIATFPTAVPSVSNASETRTKNVLSLDNNFSDACTPPNIGDDSCIGVADVNEKSRKRRNNKIDEIGVNGDGSRGEIQEPVMVQPTETETSMSIERETASGDRYNLQNRHRHDYHDRRSGPEATWNYRNPPEQQSDDHSAVPRKRKMSGHDDSDIPGDIEGDDYKSVRLNVDKKQNHSEIEKRRRDKMNTYITELSSMVPMCNAMSRKLDKLTVLKMSVQHLKTILGTVPSYTESHYKRSFLNDEELKTLILQVADGFVFAVGCDRGRILYVSESVSKTLNYTQSELLGQSWFDILHPKDVAKVKEQLSSSDLNPRERLIDAKTMLPVKTDVPQGVSRLCPGARRSFFCRMKRKVVVSECGTKAQDKEEADTSTGLRRKKQQNIDGKYCVVHCTGYLKSWLPAKMETDEESGEPESDGDGCNISCLVAVGRIQPVIPALQPAPSAPRVDPIEFVSRHAMDGKFLFVDQRATLVLGFLPQELVGTSMYEYYHHDDIRHLAKSHKAALQSADNITTRIYRFRTKNDYFVNLQSEWWSFRNPWTKEIDYLISKNVSVYCDSKRGEMNLDRPGSSSARDHCNYFTQRQDGLEKIISSHVEMSKTGRRIAEEVLNQNQRQSVGPCSIGSPNPNPNPVGFGTQVTQMVFRASSKFPIKTPMPPDNPCNILQTGDVGSENVGASHQPSNYNQMRNNVQPSNIASEQGTQSDEDIMEIIGSTDLNETRSLIPTENSDEAAMAVIMSLLEADAGLGGPVDFSGLPWPLP